MTPDYNTPVTLNTYLAQRNLNLTPKQKAHLRSVLYRFTASGRITRYGSHRSYSYYPTDIDLAICHIHGHRRYRPSDPLHDPGQISNGCAISAILAAAVILIALTACVTRLLLF